MKTRAERLMFIDELIREGHYPSTKVLTDNFDIHARTAYRDMRLLKNLLNAPLAYDSKRRGYYYTQPNWSLLNLSNSQAQLLQFLLRVDLLRRKLGSNDEQTS